MCRWRFNEPNVQKSENSPPREECSRWSSLRWFTEYRCYKSNCKIGEGLGDSYNTVFIYTVSHYTDNKWKELWEFGEEGIRPNVTQIQP